MKNKWANKYVGHVEILDLWFCSDLRFPDTPPPPPPSVKCVMFVEIKKCLLFQQWDNRFEISHAHKY